ncbi:hypothetical protein N7475_007855 [Penicillium sp. IBT 31633x]|nr:hypothetical protein N7475_007855 [Penicillium sp. IBT 31633x]
MTAFKPHPESPDVELRELQNRKRSLNNSLKGARKRLKGHGSFDLDFWKQASELEDIELAKSHVQRKISLQSYDGPDADWKNSDEAKAISQQIRAQEKSQKICQQRIEALALEAPKRGLIASFMKLFTTSKMGLGISSTGAGRRDLDKQSKFRSDMIKEYNAQRSGYEHLWCPVFGDWRDSEQVIAAHLFAYMHGQTTMDAIFGRTKQPELFSPRNGILLSTYIGRYLDCGKIVIVPSLPDRPKLAELTGWLKSDVRSLKIRVLDQNWDKLDKQIVRDLPLKYKDLDNRPLVFRSAFRPAARYLYFHYVIQVLRNAWQYDSQGDPEAFNIMKGEHGKPFWGTPGRHLPKNMLLALVEELGHSINHFLMARLLADPRIICFFWR